MGFKLLIECSKDIDELHINFSDGTSVITESKNKKDDNSIIKNTSKTKKQSQFINTGINYDDISSEIVDKPVINERERPVMVASELQNLDI